MRETQYETSTSTNDLSSDEIPSTPVVVHGRSPYGVFEVPQSVDPLRPSIDSGSPSHFSASHLADLPFSFESLPRPSFDSTTASESTGQGGIVGSSTLRIAMQVEEGDWSRRAAYGRSPTATLSEKEVRGAVVRIGGHLAGCLLSYVRPVLPRSCSSAPDDISSSRSWRRHFYSLERWAERRRQQRT